MTFMLVITCLPFAALALWIICGVLADKAGEAEWAHAERAWQESGRSVVSALRRDIYRRSRLR